MKRRIHCLATALCAAFLVAAAQAADPFGLLIEAERPTRREPPVAKGFVRPAREPAGSAGVTVAGFHGEKNVAVYEFEAPREDTYSVWLRYGSHGETKVLRAAVDPAAPLALTEMDLPVTGGYEGPGIWGWVRLFQGKLTAGRHAIAIGGAPIRPDCLYVTTATEAPTDEVIAIYEPRTLTEKEKELLAKPYAPVTPEWVEGAGDYRLPEWYDKWRVCAHTRLSFAWRDKDVFLTAAKRFRSLGLNVFVRHIKTGDEGAWWPSAVGAVHPDAKDRNWAKEIIDNAHANDCEIVVYHRHMEDAHMAEQHPDWIATDWLGNHPTARGMYMCFNSPYPDYFEKRLLELVDMGADAFYFDEIHMLKTGCWCKFCKEKFTAETGLTHPDAPHPEDPLWHRLVDFNNLTIERTFLKWRKAIHERNPNVVMLIGSNSYPAQTDRHMSQRLFRIADSMKTEFTVGARNFGTSILTADERLAPLPNDVRIARGYTLSRDACDGRPAHIWLHGLPDETAAVFATAGVITHGCIANLDMREAEIPDPATFEKAVELGNRVSPYFANTRPAGWVAVHHSEYARDQYLTDEYERWVKVLYPQIGAYMALLRAHLPVGIITDSQLEQGLLDHYPVLFLPAPQHLTDRMKQAVAQFKERGGSVIENRPEWKWHDPDGGREAAVQAFLEALKAQPNAAPIRVFGGPEKMHVMSYRSRSGRPTLIVSLVNDFSWVPHGRKAKEKKVSPPPPCEDVIVCLTGRHQNPSKAFDALTGRDLAPNPTPRGLEIPLRPFDTWAVVVVQY